MSPQPSSRHQREQQAAGTVGTTFIWLPFLIGMHSHLPLGLPKVHSTTISPAATVVKVCSVFWCIWGAVSSSVETAQRLAETCHRFLAREGINKKSKPQLGLPNNEFLLLCQSNFKVHKEVYQNLHCNPLEIVLGSRKKKRGYNVRKKNSKQQAFSMAGII